MEQACLLKSTLREVKTRANNLDAYAASWLKPSNSSPQPNSL